MCGLVVSYIVGLRIFIRIEIRLLLSDFYDESRLRLKFGVNRSCVAKVENQGYARLRPNREVPALKRVLGEL